MRPFQLGRRQTLGILFGLLGFFLVGYVAAEPRGGGQGGHPRTAARSGADQPRPGQPVLAIGIVFLLVAAATFFEHRSPRLARGALILGSVLFIPLVVILSLALSELPDTNVMQLLIESLRLKHADRARGDGRPVVRARGVVNIGIEGMLLTASGTAFVTYAVVGDANSTSALWLSVLVAIVTGGLIGLLHTMLCVTYRVDQIISGVVINLLALGLTGFLRSEVIVDTGISTGVPTGPTACRSCRTSRSSVRSSSPTSRSSSPCW